MRVSATTLAIAVLAMASALAALVPPLGFARALSGPLLAAILPGLAIVRMRPISGGQSFAALALGVPLSFAVTVLTGLLLNAFGALDVRGWSVALCSVTLAACLLRRAEPETSTNLTRDFALKPIEAMMFLMAFAVAIGAVVLAREGALAHRQFAFTEFWMTPQPPAEQNIVTLGVRNAERETTSYSVAIVSDGATIGRWPEVSLAPGETWTTDISLNSRLRRSPRVEAWLYRSQNPQVVYRKAWIAALPAKLRTD